MTHSRIARVVGYWRNCPLTWAFLASFVVVFLVQLLVVAWIGLDRANDVFYFGADWKHKPWTIVLSHLGHAPNLWYHFPFNVLGAFFIMPAAERAAGRALFLAAYWTTAILGSFLKLQLTGVESVGASAGLLGLFGYALNAMLIPGTVGVGARRSLRWGLLLPGVVLVVCAMNPAIVRILGQASHWYGFAMGGIFALVHGVGLIAKPSLAHQTRPPAAASMVRADVLYRALRQPEIDAGVLIPKGQGPFVDEPRFGMARFDDAILGPTARAAALHHQWAQNGLPTSGISTTPHFERAKFYAQRLRKIAVIPLAPLRALGIEIHVVNQLLGEGHPDLAVPEDDEHILVHSEGGPFPKALIAEIITI